MWSTIIKFVKKTWIELTHGNITHVNRNIFIFGHFIQDCEVQSDKMHIYMYFLNVLWFINMSRYILFH